ncbi:hypothetical protein PBI_JACE_91 [Gordonia phage Jace]|uniref:Uncharacterized protein n=1 Tax=Gordonia phage Jace TaxID=2182360 RepID=A0A2U8UJI3_9CAUD|nr:hypothetical protein HOT28_gp91 [Gordonia phage Jace]AWN03711.1 hypothetical protein PBI_JACE_91 [Gordonia phage Jace]
MAHELDITDGITSFADSRKDAWHQLGQQVGHVMTAEEALKESHLAGWNVRKIPLLAQVPAEITENGVTEGGMLDVPNHFATVRTNPINGGTDYLGVVGNTYTPFQNEASCDLLNALADESGAHFETAGALKGGRETFVTMKLPDSLELQGHNGNDTIDWYIAALNSHDGTSSFRFLVTPIRIVCANTQSAALRSAKASFKIRHTINATNVIREAREALGLTFKYMEEFESAAAAMIAEQMDRDRMQKFADQLTRVEDAASQRGRNQRQQQSNDIVKLFTMSETNENARETTWGAFNAVTEYVDHYMPVAKGSTNPAADRALRTLTSATATDLKLRAFELLNA